VRGVSEKNSEVSSLKIIHIDTSEKLSDNPAAMQTHADLIESLGDGTVVAAWLTERTGQTVDREAVYKWKANGVAWKFRADIAAMAGEKNIILPQNFLGGAKINAT